MTATHEWQEENEGYAFKNGSIHMLDRKDQTTLFRLRTGHCGLNKHLKKMEMAESAQCQRGATEQTPVHILQTCPPTLKKPNFKFGLQKLQPARSSGDLATTYRSSRQREALGIWRRPTEAPASEKLWGSGDDLQKLQPARSSGDLATTYRSSSQREALGIWRRTTENNQLRQPDQTINKAQSKRFNAEEEQEQEQEQEPEEKLGG